MSIPKNLRTLKINFEEADGRGITFLKQTHHEYEKNSRKKATQENQDGIRILQNIFFYLLDQTVGRDTLQLIY